MQIAVKFDFTQLKQEIQSLKRLDTNPFWSAQSKKSLKAFKEKVPIDTGDYKKSWKIKKSNKNGFVLETDKGFLFDLLEFQGARPHVIEPVRAKVLHWIDKETGQDRFAMRVQHPGFEKIPHARPFIKNNLPIIAQNFLKYMAAKKEWVKIG